MLITSRQYMDKHGIKSMQTVYNHEKIGKIKIIRKNRRIFIVENSNELDITDIKNEEIRDKIEEKNILIETYKKDFSELEKKLLIIELELKNKNIQLEAKDNYIAKLEQILKDENVRYNTLLQQMQEIIKTNQLLLEDKTKKDDNIIENKKNIFNFWKK